MKKKVWAVLLAVVVSSLFISASEGYVYSSSLQDSNGDTCNLSINACVQRGWYVPKSSSVYVTEQFSGFFYVEAKHQVANAPADSSALKQLLTTRLSSLVANMPKPQEKKLTKKEIAEITNSLTICLHETASKNNLQHCGVALLIYVGNYCFLINKKNWGTLLVHEGQPAFSSLKRPADPHGFVITAQKYCEGDFIVLYSPGIAQTMSTQAIAESFYDSKTTKQTCQRLTKNRHGEERAVLALHVSKK